ncbi:MAG: hypothetical protein RLZZ535_2754, partial [Cyanobacteriota bacterium]
MSTRELRFGFGRKLPVYLQSERSECGLTCLAMISTQLGDEIDVSDLRRKYPSSQKGSTAAELIAVASEMGMTARALRLEIDEMKLLALPAILHWDMQHFVVLAAIKNGKYIIHDPARGRLVLSEKQISDAFTGIAI